MLDALIKKTNRERCQENINLSSSKWKKCPKIFKLEKPKQSTENIMGYGNFWLQGDYMDAFFWDEHKNQLFYY